MIVPENVVPGEYVIKWTKSESNSPAKYLDVQNTVVTVVANSELVPLPGVTIETFNYVWTGNFAREVLITLDQDPATDISIVISLRNPDKNLQGSADNIVFNNFPITVPFTRGQTKKQFYIFADTNAQPNTLQYTISGTNAAQFNSLIPDNSFIIQTPVEGTDFSIFNYQATQVLENSATFQVSMSGVGVLYYLCYVNSPEISPQLGDILHGKLNIDSKWYSSGKASAELLGAGNTYTATFKIDKLYSQTNYIMIFVARSAYGSYSTINRLTFTTVKVSPGASVRFPTTTPITADKIIQAMSTILSIPLSRFYLQASIVKSNVQQNAFAGTSYNEYTILISPDPVNNSPTPVQLAAQLQTAADQASLKLLVPEYYSHIGLKINPVKHVAPRIMKSAKVVNIQYYGLTVNMQLIEPGYGYAIATERSRIGDQIPTSFQIAHGILVDNSNSQTRYFAKALSDAEGTINIVFDELKDNVEYNVYVTASNDIPYEPADLLGETDVTVFRVKTIKNPSNNLQFLLKF